MSEDPWRDPTTKVWVRHVLDDMAPKLAGSAMVMSLVPDDREGDVKFWVELGASIMMDKPIIAIAFGDGPIPAKLELIADEIVRLEHGVDTRASQALQDAMTRVMERLKRADA